MRGKRMKTSIKNIILLLCILISPIMVSGMQTFDHYFKGYMYIDNVLMGSSDTYATVSLYKDSVLIINWTMGTEGWKRNYDTNYSTFVNYTFAAGNQFVLAIPMDSETHPYAGNQGDSVALKINGVNINENPKTIGAPNSNTSFNISIDDSTEPSAPSSLAAAEVTPGTINITWSAATDNIHVLKYLVYRGTSSGVTKSTGTNIGNTTNLYYEDTGLTLDGTTYYYVVTAMDTSNQGEESNEANAQVTDTEAPSAPTGLTVSDISNAEGSLNITWNANSENDLNNYILYFSDDDGSSYTLETVLSQTYYEDSSLTDGTTYYYKIAANDTSGNPSENTTAVSGSPVDDLAPDAATSVTVEDVANKQGKLNISWTASGSSDAHGYFIFKDGAFFLNITEKTNVSIIDDSVSDGVEYTYLVSTYDEVPNFASNVSGSGTSIDDLAPAQVTGVTGSSGNHSVNISWSAVSTNSDSTVITDLAGYHTYYNNSGTWTLVRTSSLTYFNATSLTNNLEYMYKIAAYDTTGNEGQNSSIVSVTPSERPSFSATPAGSGSEIKSSVLINIT
ncbi:hypothetical protein GF378_01335, partial [Candidatus Pacearchaeota archaeon]|nr:hypothetical protein [Candidatus Pacearchaeota archaeon]